MRKKINLKPLPTRSWRSHALFRAGIAAAARGDHATAESLYIEALRDDPNNLAARVNFAGELMVERDNNPANNRVAIDLAIEQLLGVLAKLENRTPKDAIYFAALYRLASAYYDIDERTRAGYFATRLEREIADETERCIRQRKSSDELEQRTNERLRAYLEQSYPAAKVMLIGMRLEWRAPNVTLEDLRKAADVPVPTAQFQYNFACALAVYLPHEPSATKRTSLETEAVQRLRLAIRMKEDLRARARIDRSLTSLRQNKEFKTLVCK